MTSRPAESPESAVEPRSHCRTCKCFKTAPKRRSGLKRDAADARWSKMVRERAGYRCQFIENVGRDTPPTSYRCNAEVGKSLAPQGLHAAHCFGRGNPRTRLDPDNGLAMCWPHHREIDSNRPLKFAVFRFWLGEEKFDQLQAKANARRDRRTNNLSSGDEL